MLTEEPFNQDLISNVPMHKCMPGMRLDRLEIGEIAGVFQRIEIHHLMAAVNNQATNEMRPDESRSSGYKNSHLEILLDSKFLVHCFVRLTVCSRRFLQLTDWPDGGIRSSQRRSTTPPKYPRSVFRLRCRHC